MEQTLPRSIDYGATLPVGVPAIQKRRRFYPSTGAQFGPGLNPEIRIDLESANQLLDPANSYLDFVFVNNDAAASVGFDISDQVFFDAMRIEQGGRVLSRVQGLNRLNCSVLSFGQQGHDGRVSESIYGGSRGFNNAGAANIAPFPNALAGGASGDIYLNLRHNASNLIAPGATQRFSIPIQGGLFTQDKLIPLPLLRPGNPLSIVFELTGANNIGCWNGAGGIAPAAATPYIIRDVSYVGSMVEVGRDVMDQIRGVQDRMGGQLVISSQDFEYSTSNVPAGSTGDVIMRIPARHRSIKSLFWTAQSNDLANTAGPVATLAGVYNMSYGGTMNGINYQLKVGSVVYPPQPVAMSGASINAGGAVAGRDMLPRSEMIMELAKAFGSLGWTSPTGQFNTIGYASGQNGCGNGDNGLGGADIVPRASTTISGFAAGLDLDAWQRTAIEGGVDNETLAQEANLIVSVDPNAGLAGSGNEDMTCHIWVLFDQHYYFNRDGMITFSN